MAVLTYRQRERLPDSAFALPRERKYPIHDKPHARNALARVSAEGTYKEKRIVRRKVRQRYPSIRISARMPRISR